MPAARAALDGIAVVVRIEGLSRLTRCRIAEPIETVSADAPHADMNFVTSVEDSVNIVERQCSGCLETLHAEAAGQCFIVGVAGGSLIGVTDAVYPRIEIVINIRLISSQTFNAITLSLPVN